MTVEDPAPGDADLLTTMHVQRARTGDAESVGWIVERFTPVLLAQARYRLPPSVAAVHEPADVVQDVWVRVLPRLELLGERDGRHTPVLMAYLSTALLRWINTLITRQLRRGTPRSTDEETAPTLAAETLGAVRRASLSESHARVMEHIERLDDRHREVLVLRGIEQRAPADVARLLDISTNLVAQRYRRALAELRSRLPRSLFDDLGEG